MKIKFDETQATETPIETKTNKIGENEIKKALEILERYKNEKAALDSRIVKNQERWRKRYSNPLDTGKNNEERLQIHTSWLHNCIDNKVADYMDNYPEPNILAKEQSDEEMAKILSSVIPTILDEVNFEETYNKVVNYKVMNGTGVYSCIWDQSKHNGLGDIDIQQCDLLNLFWEGGIEDIQDSPHLFRVKLVDNDILKSQYPDKADKLESRSFTKAEYVNEESIDSTDKSYVIDWYYKVNVNGKDIVHYVKFVGTEILFATENEPDYVDKGIYDDGLYPFVIDVLFPIANSCTGYGYMDLLYESQEVVDKITQANVENTIFQATPRWLIRDDADFDEKAFADTSRHFIKAGATLGTESILPIQVNSIAGSSMNMYEQMIQEMKETSGNRDVSNGGTSAGVTAASAISAMQEAGSKTSRMQIRGTYRAYRNLITMIIERIRQFYDLPRTFRIIGANATQEYVTITNEKLQMQATDINLDDEEQYFRLPCFDVEVSASKSSPYSKMANNELMVQLYQLGVFNPQNADQSLALLEALDINHKDRIVTKVQENVTMLDTIQQLTQALQTSNAIITELTGQDLMSGQVMDPQTMVSSVDAPQGNVDIENNNDILGGEIGDGESTITRNARKKVAESTSPV